MSAKCSGASSMDMGRSLMTTAIAMGRLLWMPSESEAERIPTPVATAMLQRGIQGRQDDRTRNLHLPQWRSLRKDFINGKFEGRGAFIFTKGDRYEGEFKHGMPTGYGTFNTTTGKVVTGNWSSGCLRQGSRVAAIRITKRKVHVPLGRPKPTIITFFATYSTQLVDIVVTAEPTDLSFSGFGQGNPSRYLGGAARTLHLFPLHNSPQQGLMRWQRSLRVRLTLPNFTMP
jgi:hypothetical protein